MRFTRLLLSVAAITAYSLLCWNNNNAFALYRDDLSIEEAARQMETERAKIELSKEKIAEKEKAAVAFQENKKKSSTEQESSVALKENEKGKTKKEITKPQNTPIAQKKLLHSLVNPPASSEKISSVGNVRKIIGIILLLLAALVILRNKEILFSKQGKND